MMRRCLFAAIRGALYGVAAQYLLALCLSVKLRLGYLMTCLPALEEAMHGEINAAFLEAAFCALLGMGVALALAIRGRQGRARTRNAVGKVRLSSPKRRIRPLQFMAGEIVDRGGKC